MISTHRNWQTVYVQLNNTQLNIYNVTRNSPLKSLKSTESLPSRSTLSLGGLATDPPAESSNRPKDLTGKVIEMGFCRIGKLLKSYTLQYAEVGYASDYTKRLHVLRVRPEGEQILLQANSQQDHILWTNTVQMGIDLALPLEERALPLTRQVPRRRRPARDVPLSSDVISLSRSRTRDDRETSRQPSHSPSNNRTKLTRIAKLLQSKSASSGPWSTRASNDRLATATCAVAAASSPSVNSSEVSLHRVYSLNDTGVQLGSTDTLIDTGVEEYGGSSTDSDGEISDACRRRGSSGAKIQWAPVRTEQSDLSLLKYALRCLRPLPATASWLNRPVIRKGNKYIVKRRHFVKAPPVAVQA